MLTALKITLIVMSLGLILVVLLQKGKSAGLSGAITGGAEHLFGRTKARGFDLFLSRVTLVLAILFIILTAVVAYSDEIPWLTTKEEAATTTAPANGAVTPAPADGQTIQVTTPPADGATPAAPADGQTIQVTTPPADGAATDAQAPADANAGQ
jgi:preprotein translocase subunit SecG